MTPDIMIERMKNGLTMAEIAKMTNKTRNQVAGDIYRYRKEHGLKTVRGTRAFDVPKHTGADARGFLEVLERNGCKYIEGDIREDNAVYCADYSTRQGYCEKHYSMCYIGVKKREGGYL